MIVYLPALTFVVGMVAAYRTSGWHRQVATMLAIAAVGWALALLIDPSVAGWAAGPLLATLLLRRPAERAPSRFEVLYPRALVIGGMMALALFVAAQFPVGVNPLLLFAVPWLLAALGAAWLLRPIDARERQQGQVLLVAGVGAVILTAAPTGALTGAAAGAMALMPVLAGPGTAWPASRQLLSSLVLLLGVLLALLSLLAVSVPRQSLGDLTLNLSGPALLGAAIVLVAAGLVAPAGSEWTGSIAALSVFAAAPALRWPAIAALIAIASTRPTPGERPAWLALTALAAVPVLQGLAPAPASARVQTVALGVGLVLALYAARAGLLRTVVLPAIGFSVLPSIAALSAGNLTRLQWIAAVGALLLIGHAVLLRLAQEAQPGLAIGDALLMGLLLLGISARDALGLGTLGAALLLIDLAIVRPQVLVREGRSLAARLAGLSRSNWPPAITFAGVTLAVVAALQASLALGLLAALMLAGLQLAPVLDRATADELVVRPISAWRWATPAISFACGIAPALVMRMLRM